MASISAATGAPSITARPASSSKSNGGAGQAPSPALGLPKTRGRRVKCSVEEEEAAVKVSVSHGAASMLAAAAMTGFCSPALALVDERMSTEGTGLALGLSNNLLGWILLGVFGLIWSLYTVYTSGLDEDEDSGLSL